MQPICQDPALLQEFLTESEELLQRIDQDLVKLEAEPASADLLNRIFRALHTIKGTSGFFGLDPVVQVGHRAEDVLSCLRRGEIQLSRRVMDALLAARDQLSTMIADLRAGGLKNYSLDSLVRELELVQTPSPAPAAVPAADPAATAKHPAATEAVAAAKPLPGPPKHGAETANDPSRKSTHTSTAQSMRVDVRKLDELVNLTGELVLERNRLLQVVRDISAGRCDARGTDSPLGNSVARLSFITDELQAAGLRTRMVPIDTVFAKFPRMVRDIAHLLQKEVELVVEGQETEIDKTMVELISDPLVHLIRNSLDHGIELPEVRERARKPRQGTIRLGAVQEGDHILIEIADDGAGIDPKRILQRAVEKGLMSAERTTALSKREILELIFLPGFSTVDNATDLSGRGVGMDVVRSNLKKINGSIDVDSHPGKGTAILLRLPLTLAILPVLLVQVADEVYALPLRAILETSRFLSTDVHQLDGQEVVCMGNETLPLIRLQRLFLAPGSSSGGDKKIVVMAVAQTRVAILVDSLVGQESTVVKPLDSCLAQCQGIAGATVGGDGRVRLVVDPAGLLATATASAAGLAQ